MSMVIGIDAAFANLPRKTGVEWYGYQVIRHLAQIDQTTRYRLYAPEPLCDGLAELPANFEARILPRRGSWAHATLSAELQRHPVSVFYTPSFVLPWRGAPASVFTVHDIAFRHFRKNYPLRQHAHLTLNSALSAHLASKIVTVSETVRRDVASYYRVPETRLVTILSGFDEHVRRRASEADMEAAKRACGIDRPYFIFVGRLDARKNAERLVEAYLRARAEGAFHGQLLMVGNPGVGAERALALADAHPSDIRRTGYLSNAQRDALLQGAVGLVFPSLYEGFGLPILEGFAAQTPVVTSSNGGACAEIAGDAALLVDAYDTAAIAAAMARLAADHALRANLVARGLARLGAFSWLETARHVRSVLFEAAEASPRPAQRELA